VILSLVRVPGFAAPFYNRAFSTAISSFSTINLCDFSQNYALSTKGLQDWARFKEVPAYLCTAMTIMLNGLLLTVFLRGISIFPYALPFPLQERS